MAKRGSSQTVDREAMCHHPVVHRVVSCVSDNTRIGNNNFVSDFIGESSEQKILFIYKELNTYFYLH